MANGVEGLKAAGTLTGQLITISSALLAFTVTFAEKFTPKDKLVAPPLPLKISWVCFALSIAFGFLTLMALTGTLTDIDRGAGESNVARTNIRYPAMIMFVLFFAAIASLIAAGWVVAG